jgi:hypothetical protein
MLRHAYALTRYDAHSGSRMPATSSGCQRREATLAMKKATGSASTASITVTRAATPIVRIVTER